MLDRDASDSELIGFDSEVFNFTKFGKDEKFDSEVIFYDRWLELDSVLICFVSEVFYFTKFKEIGMFDSEVIF